MTVWVDFETASECDLKTAGVYNYARHPSTRVLCMAYAIDDDEVQVWTPGQPFPRHILSHQIRAHNAAFERLIFWHVLNMPFLNNFYCTAAQARANCAPGSLEDVGRFAGSSMRKDHRGAYLVRQCCVPPFREDLLPELFEYCAQDVRTMRAVSKAMRELTAEELEDYHVNERINDRGVRVDVDLCRAAVGYADKELQEIQDTVREITGGQIQSVRSPRMREWVACRLGPQALKLMDKGEKQSIDKTVRANLLALEDPEEVPPDVREVIQCADDIFASAVAKFARLGNLAGPDARVRGAFVFAGGSATGRASSYGAQLHNAPRKCAAEPDRVRQAMVRGHAIVPAFGRRVTDVLRGMLRPALIPAEGKKFVVADWSAIEGRVNPWLSKRGDNTKLQQFRDGLDVYKVNAAETFRTTYDKVTKDQRQVGKVQELACGFGGGVGAFDAMGRAYGLTLPEEEARRMVNAWRRANEWAVPFWQELETAYTRAMRNPGEEFEAGRIVYLHDGAHLWYALPSGRVLCYPYAKFEDDAITYAKAAWKPAADAKEWPRARLWRGLACENVTQATAHDLLREALRRLDDVVLHVHDEIVIETDKPEAALEELQRVMTTPPAWAAGLPLDAEASIMDRYGKG